ncbi:MAG: hypothetical protein PHN37_02690 [Candidatus Pacebacteria bacterium]|nr:hypothetical protein [Candidatus Paceibacterota bacterium]
MKLFLIIIAAIVLIIFSFSFFQKEKFEESKLLYQNILQDIPENILELTREQIISLLETNEYSLKYIKSNPGFIIEEKIVLTKESILEGQNGINFKEVYDDLELEENRYLKIKLINQIGNKGMIVVLDLKTQTVPRAFHLLLIKTEISN